MKKLKYIGILFLLILFSCVDDESRYGDIDIDEIKIEGIKDYQEIEGVKHHFLDREVVEEAVKG